MPFFLPPPMAPACRLEAVPDRGAPTAVITYRQVSIGMSGSSLEVLVEPSQSLRMETAQSSMRHCMACARSSAYDRLLLR